MSHVRGLLVSQHHVLEKLQQLISRGEDNANILNPFLHQIERDCKQSVEVMHNKINQLSHIVDQYGDQLQHQLSHFDKLQTYIQQQVQVNTAQLQSERYALYEYIHSIKYAQTDRIPFNVDHLRKEMGLDFIYDPPHDGNGTDVTLLNTLRKESVTLNENLIKLMDWKEALNKQLIGDNQYDIGLHDR
eukprot:68664_1